MNKGPHTPLQPAISLILATAACLAATSALADAPAVLGDLDPLSPEKLSKEQLDQLLPGAKMSRVSATTGSTHYWTNDADGTTTVSSDNKSAIGQSFMNRTGVTAPGKWHISPDGRYCVTIEWKKIPTEDWCRYVFKTTEGYYLSKADHNRAEKVYRFSVNGN